MGRSRAIATVAAVAAVLGLGIYAFVQASTYKVELVLPSAAQLVTGSPVWVNGLAAGAVEDTRVEDGKAVVEVSVSRDFAPLREGTTSWIQWYSAVGERVVNLTPGPAQNAEIPDGGVYAPKLTKQIEVDQIFAELTPQTRERLNTLIHQMDGTFEGSEKNIQATLNTAGPAVHALGGVLEGVGRDGPAIKALVKELNEVTSIATKHRSDVAATVRNLTAFTSPLAAQQSSISEALKELPPTLQAAQDTLNDVPPAVDATNPFLKDLRPGTDRLASFSKNLSGVLGDLRPAVDDLRPTLGSLRGVLDKTPDFLDRTHDIVPPLHRITERYADAASFLRPYTPELVGWIQNFGLSFSAYDSQGHYWSTVLGEGGPNSFNEHVTNPPLNNPVKEPKPGSLVGQPWTDAWGSKGN